MNEWYESDQLVIGIVTNVAEQENLSPKQVLESWKEFRGLPLDTQDRVLRYFNNIEVGMEWVRQSMH